MDGPPILTKDVSPRKCEFIQIKIDIPKPGSNEYAHYDYEELMEKNGKSLNDKELAKFYDEDTLNIAKKLRETKDENGKQIRVNLDELQHFNRYSGTDTYEDSFIDDTEAVDDGDFAYRKGNYYIGHGEVKDLDDEEDEEESDEEEEVVQKTAKTKKKQLKEKKDKPEARNNGGKDAESSPLSSDSGDEPVRLTGAPPTAQMTGGPPTKRPQTKRDATPPVVAKDPPPKKKALPVIPEVASISSSSSQNSDIVVLDDEPPAKKKKLSEGNPPVFKPEVVKPSNGTSSEPMKSSTKGPAVTMIAKKIVKQQEEMKEDSAVKKEPVASSKASEAPKNSSPSSEDDFNSKFKEIFEKLKFRGKIFHEKKQEVFDEDTLSVIAQFMDLVKNKKKGSDNHEALMFSLAHAFEISTEKFVELMERGMPNEEKQTEAPIQKKSRKLQMFLTQWVFLSRKYVEMILPKLKKPLSTEGYAKMQVTVVNTMKEQLKKQLTLHSNKNEKNGEDTPFVFLFTDPVLASMVPYLEELVDYALSVRKLDIAVVGIDSLHQAVEAHIPRSSFYIEICRRHQKSSFLIVEEPMKSRLNLKNEEIAKTYVIQRSKFQIDWKGEEPVMDGRMKKADLKFEKSVLWEPPRLASGPTTPSSPSTTIPGPVTLRTSDSVPSSKPSNPSTSSISEQAAEETPKILQAMNQLVIVDRNVPRKGHN